MSLDFTMPRFQGRNGSGSEQLPPTRSHPAHRPMCPPIAQALAWVRNARPQLGCAVLQWAKRVQLVQIYPSSPASSEVEPRHTRHSSDDSP
jgi:hypothetical protein